MNTNEILCMDITDSSVTPANTPGSRELFYALGRKNAPASALYGTKKAYFYIGQAGIRQYPLFGTSAKKETNNNTGG